MMKQFTSQNLGSEFVTRVTRRNEALLGTYDGSITEERGKVRATYPHSIITSYHILSSCETYVQHIPPLYPQRVYSLHIRANNASTVCTCMCMYLWLQLEEEKRKCTTDADMAILEADIRDLKQAQHRLTTA